MSVIIQWIKDNYHKIAIWVGPLILFGSLLIQGKVVFWGTTYLQFTPWHLVGWDEIASGHFPLWNNFNGYGAPLLANYQSAFFYPPNLLIWIFAQLSGIRGIVVAQTLLVIIHLVISGYGIIYLSKEIGTSKIGQAVSGIAYSMGGYLISRSSFLSMNACLAWLPWLLLIELRIANYSNWKTILHHKNTYFGVATIAMLVLSGHAQLAWYTLLLAFIWMIAWSLCYSHGKRLLIHFSTFCIITIFAVGICAIQLLPTAEFLLQSSRASQVDYSYAMNYSFWPWRLLTLLSPNLFGNPANGNYWVTADNYWEDNIYSGILIAIFALVTIVRLFQRKYREHHKIKFLSIFSLSIISISIILSLGKNTPIFPFLYKYIPTFNMFQAPARFSIWMIVFVAILAGLSIDNWIKPSGKWLYWSRLLFAGAIGITLTSILVNTLLCGRFQKTYAAGITWTGVCLSILLLLNLFAPRSKEDVTRPSGVMTAGILLFLIGDLVFASWGVNPGLSQKEFMQYSKNNIHVPPDQQSLVYIPEGVEEEVKYSEFFRFDSFHPSLGWEALPGYFIPNSNIFDRVTSANNFDPLVSQRYVLWSKVIFPTISSYPTAINNFWGIGTINDGSPFISSGQPQKLDNGSRLRWFDCSISATDMEDSVTSLQSLVSIGHLEKVVIIENGNHSPTSCGNSGTNVTYSIIQSQSTYSKVEANTDNPGWLMQLATNYPGWTAKIDGEVVKLWYADVLFRAVYLPSGHHIVEFQYKPTSFAAGIIISICSLVGLTLSVLFICKNRNGNGRD